MMTGERYNIRLEVENDHVLMVFPKPCEDVIMPWQSAMGLGSTLQRAAEDIPNKPLCLPSICKEIIEPGLDVRRYHNMVALIFKHTGKIKLSYEAARYVGRRICQAAQDEHFEKDKGVFLKYDVPGREGRVTPCWDGNRLPKSIPVE